jgi:aspartyl-tRNA synthetase
MSEAPLSFTAQETAYIARLHRNRVKAGHLRASDAGNTVMVSGWVFRYRDQGGLVFVDLRDRSGILQLVFDKSELKDRFDEARSLRCEFVIGVEGVLRRRDPEAVNPKLATGEVELLVKAFIILNRSRPLPFPLDEYSDAGEETRLRYRYLDLRREEMRDAILLRSQMNQAIRRYLEAEGFIEVETPILNKSTPEGARDFLVPSRLSPNKFYALPQSPQLFKQILMVAGFEKYFQIVKCFRDEDLRADRQPEFTQLDLEMSFVDEGIVTDTLERMWRSVVKEVFNVQLPDRFPRMSYHEAVENYGTDRPDLRFDMKLVDIADIALRSEFQVFRTALQNGGRVKALCVPGGASLSRKDIDDLTEWVKQDFKAGGLAWMKHENDGLKSVVSKFFSDDLLKELAARTGSRPGDIIFFAGDRAKVVHDTLGNLRLRMAKRFHLIPEDTWAIVWVEGFPLFERDPETGELTSVHHPFTAPLDEHLEILFDEDRFRKEGDKILSRAYDLVLNGTEIGGGSIRIHNAGTQLAVLQRLGINEEEAREKFGFLLDALSYGAPPHGGIAFGLDRILALFLHRESIRDVIAFPKTQKGYCLMSQSPSTVDVKQLQELRIRTIPVN